ncbi:MAG: RHS repeat-associated core domain-containing protein, partial [Candidatus Bipolaricaulis sp.]|nr:RHS repeat-associated core domain-containing protein [Candidatus Bipolaricaulis sp.]
HNSKGKPVAMYAQDGKTVFDVYDFKGNVVSLTKIFAIDYQTLLDWSTAVALQTETFQTQTQYDAMNRPVQQTQPDSTQTAYHYNKAGLLERVLHNQTEYVSNVNYNAKGQRTDIYYGNNSKTRYYYNSQNYRLIRLLTTRNAGQDTLQDLNYTYDAVGNITEVLDNAQQTHYFNNAVIEPKGQYWYDALYRITKATGRELNSLQLPTHEDFVNSISLPNSASNAMQNYTQTYQYDKLGNILQMKSGTQWTRDYVYGSGTNYLLKHDTEQTLNDYTYDAHGNMLTMIHLTTMEWDTKDQLVGAGNGTFQSFYAYDNTGNRTRKVVVKGNVREERYYLGGFEVYRKTTNGILDVERKTILVSNDEKNIALLETDGTVETIRYQYDNLIGSSCLELDENANIITYEEYHPFGTTSYRAGINQTEVKRKRYRYVAKEHDDESGFYYYKHRYYAAWIARFISVDKLQHKFPELTPYQYASNRPIIAIDLDGLEALIVNKQDRTYTFMANIYMVTRGNGAVDANMFEKAIQDHLSNLPEERRKAPDGFTTEFKFNYITKDDYNQPLTYETAKELAKISEVTYNTADGREFGISGFETGVVVTTDLIGKEKFRSITQKGEFVHGIDNEKFGKGKFNSIRMNSELEKSFSDIISKPFVHEFGHFLGIRGIPGTKKDPQLNIHAPGFGGAGIGITSRKDDNIRLTPFDIGRMIFGTMRKDESPGQTLIIP